MPHASKRQTRAFPLCPLLLSVSTAPENRVPSVDIAALPPPLPFSEENGGTAPERRFKVLSLDGPIIAPEGSTKGRKANEFEPFVPLVGVKPVLTPISCRYPENRGLRPGRCRPFRLQSRTGTRFPGWTGFAGPAASRRICRRKRRSAPGILVSPQASAERLAGSTFTPAPCVDEMAIFLR